MNDFYPLLHELIQSRLTANAIDEGLAGEIAKNIIDDVANAYGGQAIYLKNNTAERMARKHAQIVAEYDGKNSTAICRKYQITSTWLKRLLARARNEPAN
jgi:Mor family transcriptional regulator